TRGVAASGCAIAALIGERDIRQTTILRDARESRTGNAASIGPSDLLALLDLFTEAEGMNFAPERLRAMNLDPGTVMAVDRVRRQLLRTLGAHASRVPESRDSNNSRNSTDRNEARGPRALPGEEQSLLISILSGYPDRVARRRKSGEAELLLSG